MPSNSLLKLFLRSLSMLSITAFAVAAVMVPKALLSPSYISGSNLHLITHHFLSGVEIQQLERKNYLNKDSIVQ